MRTPSAARPADQIVVGIDGSDSAVGAAVWAAHEADRYGTPLRLVHSYFQPILYYPPFATSTTANKALLAQARRDLTAVTAAVRGARPDVQVHTALQYGHPVSTLLEESMTARMLVLGARGRHGFEGLLLGSTAVAVTAHARCPVAVVRGETGGPSLPVVAGVDGSPVSDDAVGVAFEEASARGVLLVAVHAWSEIPSEGMFSLIDPPEQLQRVEDDERRLLAEQLTDWQEKFPGVPVERVVARQRPAAALLEWSAKAQLVVVGSHGRGGFAGMLLGSTSQALLHHAACPVIVVRPVRH